MYNYVKICKKIVTRKYEFIERDGQMSDAKKLENNRSTKFLLNNLSEIPIPKGKAIEIGCGGGSDTAYLIRKGWEVLALDVCEEAKECCLKKLITEDEKKRFKFICGDFQNIDLPKCDLLIMFKVLNYCWRSELESRWKKIEDSIAEGGYFVGSFLSTNHDLAKEAPNKIFLDYQEIEELFKNFNIRYFEREISDNHKSLRTGEKIHSEKYSIIAQKKKNLVV